MSVQAIPEGFHSVTPYLVVENPPRLIEFMTEAFGARELYRSSAPDGRVMHALVQLGDSRIMIGGALGGSPTFQTMLYLYVPDTDSVYRAALEAGGTSLREPADEFYGDRNAGVKDPAGNSWWIATHIEDVPSEELERRARARGQG